MKVQLRNTLAKHSTPIIVNRLPVVSVQHHAYKNLKCFTETFPQGNRDFESNLVPPYGQKYGLHDGFPLFMRLTTSQYPYLNLNSRYPCPNPNSGYPCIELTIAIPIPEPTIPIPSCTHAVGGDSELDEAGELALVRLVVVLLQVPHVVGHVLAEDVVTVHTRVEVLALGVVAGEAFVAVRDVETAIDGALHGSEHLGAGGGARQTDVQVAAERARTVVHRLHQVVGAVHVLVALVHGVEGDLLEQPARDQQTGAVGSRVVGEPDLDAVLGQLVSVCGAHDHVSLKTSIRYLHNTGDTRSAISTSTILITSALLISHKQEKATAVNGLSA